MSEVRTALNEEDYLLCKKAILALRPGISEGAYPEMIRRTLADNRRMIFIGKDGIAAAVAVFETGFNLHRGSYIYIDDLSTVPEYRGHGYAGKLIDWILDYAKAEGYHQVHLDSGVTLERTEAHRLYLNKRFVVTSLHFVREM